MNSQINIKKKNYDYAGVSQDVDGNFRLSRAQAIILEHLPLNPKAGAVIAAKSILNARMLAFEEGIGRTELNEGVELLVRDGHLEKTKNYSYTLTALGARYLFSAVH